MSNDPLKNLRALYADAENEARGLAQRAEHSALGAQALREGWIEPFRRYAINYYRVFVGTRDGLNCGFDARDLYGYSATLHKFAKDRQREVLGIIDRAIAERDYTLSAPLWLIEIWRELAARKASA